MLIINIMAVSLDGKISAQKQENAQARRDVGLSNEDDRILLLDELQNADAVIMGADTLRTDGALMEVKNKRGFYPHWYILSNQGFAPELPFWQQDHIPRSIYSSTAEQSIHNPKVKHKVCAEASKMAQYLAADLKQNSFQKVLLFGGGKTNALFYAADLVDELKLTIAPIILGGLGADFIEPLLPSPKNLQLLGIEHKNDFVFLHYKVNKQR